LEATHYEKQVPDLFHLVWSIPRYFLWEPFPYGVTVIASPKSNIPALTKDMFLREAMI